MAATASAAATSSFIGTRLTDVYSGTGRVVARFGFGKKAAKKVAKSKAPTTDRPLWYPGVVAPDWLDGSLIGDYGFDPFGLGKRDSNFDFGFFVETRFKFVETRFKFNFDFGAGPSLDLDLLPGSSSAMPNLPFQPVVVSDMDKSLMSDIASNALEEMLKLLQTNEPLWIKSTNDGRDVLNLESYERMFPKPNSQFKYPNIRIEASRVYGVVIMNGLALVDMFMDSVSSLISI